MKFDNNISNTGPLKKESFICYFEKGLVIMHLLKQKKTNMCHGALSFDLFLYIPNKHRELNEIEMGKQPQTGLGKQLQTEFRGCIQQMPQDLYKSNKKQKHHKLRSWQRHQLFDYQRIIIDNHTSRGTLADYDLHA